MASLVHVNVLMKLILAGGGVVVLGTMQHVLRQRMRRIGRRYDDPPRTKQRVAIDSATTTAALAQRITGPGSGPYSGTPFPPDDDAIEAGGLSEGPSHEHGIIDHNRHVSSIGRR